MQEVARVVLALEADDVAEEVMHFLDRSGSARVVGTAGDDRQLVEAVRQLEPDAIVAHPSLVAPASASGPAVLALDTRESVASLRAAIRVGAQGFYLWPGERDALAAAAAATGSMPRLGDKRAMIVAVHGARGGVGSTFVATHLAQAFTRRDLDCVLLDADPTYGDISAALGVPDDQMHTIADLVPLVPELTPAHLGDALWTHPAGFRALAAPSAERAASVSAAALAAIVRVAAASHDAVVVSVPRELGELTLSGLASADRVLEVLSLDVLSFRAATRAIDVFRPSGVAARVGFVVNRASRSEITPGDVERVFGAVPLAVVPADRAVPRAQDRGRLVPPKGRVGRAFAKLAGRVLEDPEAA
ncbi:MAG: AAA family ATPase [Actinomycetota bacterium]|nr:AAA family ATPase [Actinomycetota bacterium]MDH5223373.1 AAA family ATPase [Actinomycetota bacterium]MDH5312555.1 AAA family ATPase [Actinomycetota bacterium]